MEPASLRELYPFGLALKVSALTQRHMIVRYWLAPESRSAASERREGHHQGSRKSHLIDSAFDHSGASL